MTTHAVNRSARFDYEILETIEGGLVLSGPEVKSIRTGHVNLAGGYITFHANTAYLTNAHIAKYRHAGNIVDYNPERSRPLLLKKRQVAYLRGKTQEKGLTIVPLSLYTKGRYIKIEIGVARGKKKYDKRQVIKERELKREIGRKVRER